MSSGEFKRFWVLGAGKFGSAAVRSLLRNSPKAEITVVDKTPYDPPNLSVQFVRCDAIPWFAENFTQNTSVDSIVPAIPEHLFGEWLKYFMKANGLLPSPWSLPRSLLDKLPNPVLLSDSKALLSHANFLCPTTCIEPENICSHTRLPRPQPLYTLIKEVCPASLSPCVIRSHQLAPGVGGLIPHEIWDIYDGITSSVPTPLLTGTSCKCHGVIEALHFH